MTLEELRLLTPEQLVDFVETASDDELQQYLLAVRKSRRERTIIKPKTIRITKVPDENEDACDEESEDEQLELDLGEANKKPRKKKEETADLDAAAQAMRAMGMSEEVIKQALGL